MVSYLLIITYFLKFVECFVYFFDFQPKNMHHQKLPTLVVHVLRYIWSSRNNFTIRKAGTPIASPLFVQFDVSTVVVHDSNKPRSWIVDSSRLLFDDCFGRLSDVRFFSKTYALPASSCSELAAF